MSSSSLYSPSFSGSSEPQSSEPELSPQPEGTSRKEKAPRTLNYHINVYEASSSLLNYDGRYLHKQPNTIARPASADELIAHNYKGGAAGLEAIKDEPIPADHLPDSDLLKAIHQYASDFYEAKGWGKEGYKMMDETAMLAVGVLLEETMREMLGDNGAVALVERDEEWCGAEHEYEDEEDDEKSGELSEDVDGEGDLEEEVQED